MKLTPTFVSLCLWLALDARAAPLPGNDGSATKKVARNSADANSALLGEKRWYHHDHDHGSNDGNAVAVGGSNSAGANGDLLGLGLNVPILSPAGSAVANGGGLKKRWYHHDHDYDQGHNNGNAAAMGGSNSAQANGDLIGIAADVPVLSPAGGAVAQGGQGGWNGWKRWYHHDHDYDQGHNNGNAAAIGGSNSAQANGDLIGVAANVPVLSPAGSAVANGGGLKKRWYHYDHDYDQGHNNGNAAAIGGSNSAQANGDLIGVAANVPVLSPAGSAVANGGGLKKRWYHHDHDYYQGHNNGNAAAIGGSNSAEANNDLIGVAANVPVASPAGGASAQGGWKRWGGLGVGNAGAVGGSNSAGANGDLVGLGLNVPILSPAGGADANGGGILKKRWDHDHGYDNGNAAAIGGSNSASANGDLIGLAANVPILSPAGNAVAHGGWKRWDDDHHDGHHDGNAAAVGGCNSAQANNDLIGIAANAPIASPAGGAVGQGGRKRDNHDNGNAAAKGGCNSAQANNDLIGIAANVPVASPAGGASAYGAPGNYGAGFPFRGYKRWYHEDDHNNGNAAAIGGSNSAGASGDLIGLGANVPILSPAGGAVAQGGW